MNSNGLQGLFGNLGIHDGTRANDATANGLEKNHQRHAQLPASWDATPNVSDLEAAHGGAEHQHWLTTSTQV